MSNRTGAIALALSVSLVVATAARDTEPRVPKDEASLVHAVDRLTFGATREEVAQARSMGLERWIDDQLKPDHRDDPALAARLAPLETLTLPSATIARDYLRPARLERRERQLREASAPAASPDMEAAPGVPGGARQKAGGDRAPSAAQRKRQQVVRELSEAKVLRAVYSDHQLEEVLVDFWFNHFNVSAGKGATQTYVTAYERDVIRPHVFGDFRTLLGAVARSPAMLFYLDGWTSRAADGVMTSAQVDGASRGRRVTADGGRVRRGGAMPRARRGERPDTAPTAPPKRPRGLNENYARELLELHTLGVDGGYTQQDIVDVARAFTGWTIERPNEEGGGFRFAPAAHDAAAKTILGHAFPAGGGENEGERVLDLVATHPSTARFIATKLARRFVSDEPPASLVDRAAARFTATKGDLREVVRTIVTAPEFFADAARHAKVKTPFEFTVSALRVSGADVVEATAVVRSLRDLGMPPYLCQPPTGYADDARTWVSSGALVARMNFALALATGRLRGVSLPAGDDGIDAVRERLASQVWQGRATAATLATLDKASTAHQALALALGSPEFQRH